MGGGWELYAFGSYGERDGLSAANYRNQNAAANRDFGALLPNQTPNAANFVPLTADGFLPYIDTDLQDYAGTAGVRGEVAGWNADFSIGYGHNSFDYTVRNTLNTSFGTNSQNVFDAGGLRYGQTVANLDFSRQYDVGLATPLSVAVGAEYRSENFQIRPGDTQSFATGPLFRASFATTAANCATQQGVYNAGTGICSFPGRAAPAGAQGFPGIPTASTTDEGRHSFAGYVELDADLFENFTAVLAGRFEHFSDFGSTVNGKLAVRYEPVSGYALRGSISNGFRAPSLHQQFFTTTSTNFINGLPVDISTLAVNSPVARALGSRDLEPEKSLNLSFGGTANPVPGLTLTVDFYRIDIDNRIVLTENLGAAGSGTAAVNAAVKAVLDANGFQSVGAARDTGCATEIATTVAATTAMMRAAIRLLPCAWRAGRWCPRSIAGAGSPRASSSTASTPAPAESTRSPPTTSARPTSAPGRSPPPTITTTRRSSAGSTISGRSRPFPG